MVGMTATDTFDPAAHPRAASGRFTEKRNDAPTGELAEAVDQGTSVDLFESDPAAALAEYERPRDEDYAEAKDTDPDADPDAVERRARVVAKLRAPERMFTDGVPHPGDDIFETIWTTDVGGHGAVTTVREIDRYKDMRAQLADGRMSPRDIIGGGYRGNTRKLANEWIDRQQAMFERALVTRGRNLTVNAANVDYRLRNGS